ncbi:hypothetical protein PO124_03900 [Bacillus licheniformis]|nr:hypothetical protein [Bacillus licheniformis]
MLGAVNLIVIGMISGVVNIYIEGYLQRVTEGEIEADRWALSLRSTALYAARLCCRRDVVGGRQSGIFIPHRRTARAVRCVSMMRSFIYGKTDEGNGRFAG